MYAFMTMFCLHCDNEGCKECIPCQDKIQDKRTDNEIEDYLLETHHPELV